MRTVVRPAGGMETAAAAPMAHMVTAMVASTAEAPGHMERVIAAGAMKSAAVETTAMKTTTMETTTMKTTAMEAAESARFRRTGDAHRCRE